MRRLRIKLDDFELLFEATQYPAEAYLDTETGAVHLFDGDIDTAMEILRSDPGEAETPEDLDDADVEALIEKTREELESGDRYIHLPEQNSREGYRDMQEFIWSLTDEPLSRRLEDAIHGKGAFRRFKAAIAHYPATEAAWYKFRDARQRERMDEWLAEHDIEADYY